MKLAEKIILSALKKLPKNELDFNTLKRKLGKIEWQNNGQMHRNLPNKTELLKAYHRLVKSARIKLHKPLEQSLTRRAVRTLSGVAIVTSLTKPYPCPGECVYCPLDERMPKSYLSDEPAAARALALKFDPFDQMARRIEALENNGHPTDKIELIIKGGTWNSYPLPYQYWFILRSFEAANSRKQENEKARKQESKKTRKQENEKTRKQSLGERSSLADLRASLFKEQKKNETAKHRIVGLTLETRPDFITDRTCLWMREMGTTRIELGIQHTDDKILNLTKRGHSIKRSQEATEMLRNFGFKVDFHLMPMLPGATAKTDLKMLEEVFKNKNLRPDMIKIYPCSVVENSELYEWHKAGKYHTYSTKKLVEILKIFKAKIPYYCRISRLIRDIPGHYIKGGSNVTNLRQIIQTEMKAESTKCRCLRCREVGHVDLTKIKDLTPHLFVIKYKGGSGTEYFLSYEDKKRQVVFAFCRLRICNKTKNQKIIRSVFPSIIRELHTYGQLMPLMQKNKKTKKQTKEIQHTGLGKKLVLEAEKITKKSKIKTIAVISGVGVRGYYRALGYKLEDTYLVKVLRY